MAIVQLPIIPGQEAFEFRIDLDSRTYVMQFSFNQRTARWSMNLMDDARNDLVLGIPVIVKHSLLGLYRADANVPQGTLHVVNVTDEDVNPSLEGFGVDSFLLYDEAV